MVEIICATQTRDAYFWATHAGAGLELLQFRGGQPIGFEVKHTATPRTTRSMRSALQDLALRRLYIVCPGEQSDALDGRISALSFKDLPQRLSVPVP